MRALSADGGQSLKKVIRKDKKTGHQDHGVCVVSLSVRAAFFFFFFSLSSLGAIKHAIKSGSDGPDQEIKTPMKNILKDCDDIETTSDAREERELTPQSKGKLGLGGKMEGGRNALHDEEDINDYVKEVFPKDDNVRRLIYKSIEDNMLFEENTQDELIEIVDTFQPCNFGAGEAVIQQGQKGDEFYVVEKGELSVTVCTDVEQGETSVDGNEVKIESYSDGSAFVSELVH
ncbi:hypothetical protein THAOC_27206 [Thalassiosira oceanica]|uniref:Cyclic nucleotide-binding domain-containing protein n=1 Tax=Thalassiosira oceanica TaxID=159749 RepID=K0RM53_THAOC|nr:hypothetical protein THAOC_27206 [Thalassiosira oceanica]|eukprot:EJK53374.1 hypothetical protein THAOC_27206 [Thalassiosira oceanica]